MDAVARIRRDTAASVAQTVAVYLGQEGPLSGLTSAEEARGRGYVPFHPDTVFDDGNLRSLDEMLATRESMGILDDATPFLAQPLYDQFRRTWGKQRNDGRSPGKLKTIWTRLRIAAR